MCSNLMPSNLFLFYMFEQTFLSQHSESIFKHFLYILCTQLAMKFFLYLSLRVCFCPQTLFPKPIHWSKNGFRFRDFLSFRAPVLPFLLITGFAFYWYRIITFMTCLLLWELLHWFVEQNNRENSDKIERNDKKQKRNKFLQIFLITYVSEETYDSFKSIFVETNKKLWEKSLLPLRLSINHSPILLQE